MIYQLKKNIITPNLIKKKNRNLLKFHKILPNHKIKKLQTRSFRISINITMKLLMMN